MNEVRQSFVLALMMELALSGQIDALTAGLQKVSAQIQMSKVSPKVARNSPIKPFLKSKTTKGNYSL